MESAWAARSMGRVLLLASSLTCTSSVEKLLSGVEEGSGKRVSRDRGSPPYNRKACKSVE